MSIVVSDKITGLRSSLNTYRREGQSIAFVPTMGALHKGHLSLIEKASEKADCCVCSIFVNPTQFNEQNDLDTYPRDTGDDLRKILRAEVEQLFIPKVDEIYPSGLDESIDFEIGSLGERMEGTKRPGHFEGVVQVVHRLLDIVEPDFIFMGQKDYQQWAIIRKMSEKLHPGVEVLMGPTVREEDGLAMSSRNQRLTPEMRVAAPALYEALQKICIDIASMPPEKLVERATEHIEQNGLEPEYVELVEGRTLLPVRNTDDHEVIVACSAVWAGDVRLIDNVICKGNPG